MKNFLLILFFLLFFGLTSVSLGKTILSDEAKEMLDDHIKQSELLKVSLPSVNRVIKDYKRFKDYRINILARNYHYTSYMWQEKSSKGELLTKEVCMDIVAEFRVPTTPIKEEKDFKKCLNSFMTYAVINFDDGIKAFKELLLKITHSKKDYWTYKDSGVKNFNPRDYNLWGVLAPLVSFYAVNFEELDYTEKEHSTIQQYFKKKAMTERFNRDGDGRIKCDITNPMNFWRDKHSNNNCGSVRSRMAPAELALAIVMQDEELWAKGLWDLDYILSMIEEEGFFVPMSSKGCKALGYTWDTSKLFSLSAEILKLADFNLLDYKTRHGKTVAEAYEMLFKQYEDITISNHIAKKGFGAVSCGIKPYKTHNEFFAYEYGVEVKEVDEIIQDNIENGRKARPWVATPEDYINWSIRFVAEKHPEWIENKRSLKEIKVHPWLSQYYYVQSFEIYNANIMTENSNIWIEKDKLAEKKTELVKIKSNKEAQKCAESELNGEYKASWIFHNIAGGYDPTFKGSEKLIIENCIGTFDALENFQPSKELRKNLKVSLRSNGEIEVNGDLDFADPGFNIQFTTLKGNIINGTVSGYWTEGSKIILELDILN